MNGYFNHPNHAGNVDVQYAGTTKEDRAAIAALLAGKPASDVFTRIFDDPDEGAEECSDGYDLNGGLLP